MFLSCKVRKQKTSEKKNNRHNKTQKIKGNMETLLKFLNIPKTFRWNDGFEARTIFDDRGGGGAPGAPGSHLRSHLRSYHFISFLSNHVFDEIDTSTTFSLNSSFQLGGFPPPLFLPGHCVRNVSKKRKRKRKNNLRKSWNRSDFWGTSSSREHFTEEGRQLRHGRPGKPLIPRTEQKQTQHLTLRLNYSPGPWKDQRSIYPTCLRASIGCSRNMLFNHESESVNNCQNIPSVLKRKWKNAKRVECWKHQTSSNIVTWNLKRFSTLLN